jgi:hypothetical protein
MSQDPILDIDDKTTYTVDSLANEYNVAAVRVPENELSQLTPVEYHLIEILKLTGPEIFDDVLQWSLYQNTIEALRVVDLIHRERSLNLSPYGIQKHAPNNYNPLGELGELDEPQVKYLSERYKCQPPSDTTSEDTAHIQSLIAGSLLELGEAHVREAAIAELHCLEALVRIDDNRDTQTEIEIETEQLESNTVPTSIIARVSNNASHTH